jgi:type II secretory pathway pseudopilin PulG
MQLIRISYNHKKQYKAFSLVEILVVLGLFSSIATLSLGALFNTQAMNTRLQETQSILDNVNLSLQSVTRDIRFGSDFQCLSTVPLVTSAELLLRKNCIYGDDGSSGGGSVLVFKSGDAENDLDRVALYADNGILYKKNIPNSGSVEILQMTSSSTYISSLTFFVKGAQSSDGSTDVDGARDYEQPIVTVMISGYTKASNTGASSTAFDIQTHISAREPDNR